MLYATVREFTRDVHSFTSGCTDMKRNRWKDSLLRVKKKIGSIQGLLHDWEQRVRGGQVLTGWMKYCTYCAIGGAQSNWTKAQQHLQ